MELWPIVLACQKWSSSWLGRKIRVYTNNTQVLYMINTGRSSSVACTFWLREFFWLGFIFNFHIVASHVLLVDNVVPDYLSRFCDSKRNLTLDLCCFRSGLVRIQVEEIPV